MRHLVVLGAGEFARQVIGIVQDRDREEFDHSLVGFIDSGGATELEGLPILGGDEQMGEVDADYVIGVGSPGLRSKLGSLADDHQLRSVSLIHSASWVDQRSTVGEGTIVAQCAHVQYGAHVGRHVVVNLNSVVVHDSSVGDYSVLANNVTIGARARVGSEVFLGMNSVVLGGITVDDGVTIGAGAVVTKDVPPGACMVGVPARPIRRG